MSKAADDVSAEGLSLLPHHPRPGLPGKKHTHKLEYNDRAYRLGAYGVRVKFSFMKRPRLGPCLIDGLHGK